MFLMYPHESPSGESGEAAMNVAIVTVKCSGGNGSGNAVIPIIPFHALLRPLRFSLTKQVECPITEHS